MRILGEPEEGVPGRGVITDPTIIEQLVRPSAEAFEEIRRLEEAHGNAVHRMRLEPWNYMVD